MKKRQQEKRLEQQSFRFAILPLFSTYVGKHIIPLHIIQVIAEIIIFIQILKFPIDYFSLHWFGKQQAIFSFLDITYYLNYTNQLNFQSFYFLSIVCMNLYWITQLSLFLINTRKSCLHQNIKKLIFILNKSLLLLQFANLSINTHNCDKANHFLPCYSIFNSTTTIICILSFAMYSAIILVEEYLNFEIIKHQRQFRRLRKSSLSTTCLLIYGILNQLMSRMVNELNSLIILNVSFILLMIIFYVKDEELHETIKLIQISGLLVNMMAILMLDLIVFVDEEISIALFFFISAPIAFGVMKYSPHSLTFEIQNINRWHNSDIMVRYAQNLRYYISRVNQYSFKVDLQGYIEMHMQKCDNEACPLRVNLTELEKEQIQTGKINKEDEYLLRLNNLIKKIYLDGYQQIPVSPQLQLQYAIFLYEKGEKKLSLKKLLLIPFDELSFQMYYKFNFLKTKIHIQMQQQPDKIFLDLVSQLHVKEKQRIILANFEKAAMINLQFWSVLKQEHPNFKKLNEIGADRIKIREQIRSNYEAMSKIVNNEKITNIYVHYLENIENYEQQYNQINQRIHEHYELEERIILQDWVNSSQAVLLVSIEESSYATIIDLNTTCSILFGYERFQLLNRQVKYLFANQEEQSLNDFMASTSREQTYMLAHKNGFLLKINKVSKIYNSFETGITAIINLTSQPIINTCSFAIRKDKTIIGSSSSIISLLGIERKIFEKNLLCKDFFKFELEQMRSRPSSNLYCLRQLVKAKFDLDILHSEEYIFNVRLMRCINCELVQFINVGIDVLKSYTPFKPNKPVSFEFQIQADLKNFKYFGSYQSYDNYITQFSQLHYAESYHYSKQMSVSYSSGIKTLRLNYDIIQVIQQAEEDPLRNYQRKDTNNSESDLELQQKYEEEIFQNKVAYQNFIKNYTFARSVIYVFLLWVVALLAVFTTYCMIYQSHDREILDLSSRITYQNLIIGAIAKEISLLKSLEHMKTEPWPYIVDVFLKIYKENLVLLQQIKLKGVEAYYLYLDQDVSQQIYLTRQFLLTFLKEANVIFDQIGMSVTEDEIKQNYKKVMPIEIIYIIEKGGFAKEYMISMARKSVEDFYSRITHIIIIQILMFIIGIIFLVLLTLSILMSIHKINQERIRIFSIFLDISQIKIQYFSSNTQKFLASLHTQDPNSEIDVDQQVENVKKINSAVFAKKKKLIQINFNKLIYVKFLMIPLLGSIYFIESFIQNYTHIKFQLESHNYFYLTSYADYKFYTGLSQLQDSIQMNQSSTFNTISAEYFEYYRDYFALHFITFANINDYHEAFTYIFMNNICKGKDFQTFGSFKIELSCKFDELSQNGSYLVFTDMAMKTSFLQKASFDEHYIYDYEILSVTHRLISRFMLRAQEISVDLAIKDNSTTLLVWTLIMGIVSFIFGLPIIYLFIEEINLIKNIITIIPISLVKQLPLAFAYFNRILKQKQGSC